jgi:hypothetical protein
MSEGRVACRTRGCPHTILPATAARTGGICRPCEQRIAWEEHDAYVRANRREVDPFAGVTDPVEVVRILAGPKTHDELVVKKPFPHDVGDYFQALSPTDVARVEDLAISWLAEHTDQAQTVALWLAVFTRTDLGRLQDAMVASGHFYPGIAFRGAAPAIRERLLEAMRAGDENPHHLLIALAWAGDAAAVAADRAGEAGWEVDAAGRRRNLYYDAAFALTRASADGQSPVAVAVRARESCRWCRTRLTDLLQVDTADPRLAALPLPPRVATCMNCTCYGPLFMRITASGDAVWHEQNERPRYLTKGETVRPEVRLVLGAARGPLHAAHPFLPTTVSQLGGAPGWMQSAEYPRCPGCRTTMPFIAQVSPEELMDSPQEGFYYAFWCSACRVTATGYQQT